MTEPLDRQIERYMADDLSPAEERVLAQAALDDPALFDMLTAVAMAKESSTASQPSAGVSDRNRLLAFTRTRKARVTLAATLTVAAAAALAFVMIPRLRSSATGGPTVAVAPSPPSPGGTTPSGPVPVPLILAAGLVPHDFRLGPFRGRDRNAQSASRLPKSDGQVTAINDGEVTIDLGVLDGLEKGAIVSVFRAPTDTTPAGSVTIARVFYERATGFGAVAGSLKVGDRVELAITTQVSGLVDQVAAHVTAGDVAGARGLAERAVSIAASRRLPADYTRRALVQLGTLEYEANELEPAERHLREAVATFESTPSAARVERGEILNALGAVLIKRERHAEAEQVLRRAQEQASGAVSVHVTNNLAALAEIRGERAEAGALYRAALAMAADDARLRTERLAIARNLQRLDGER